LGGSPGGSNGKQETTKESKESDPQFVKGPTPLSGHGDIQTLPCFAHDLKRKGGGSNLSARALVHGRRVLKETKTTPFGGKKVGSNGRGIVTYNQHQASHASRVPGRK